MCGKVSKMRPKDSKTNGLLGGNMKRLAVFAVALVVAVGCSSMKISNDYDRQSDFSEYRTYAWHS